jgi:hypothetical protein
MKGGVVGILPHMHPTDFVQYPYVQNAGLTQIGRPLTICRRGPRQHQVAPRLRLHTRAAVPPCRNSSYRNEDCR